MVTGPHLTLLIQGREFLPTMTGHNVNVLSRSSKADTPDLPAPAGHEWLHLALQTSAKLKPTDEHSASAMLLVGQREVDLTGKIGRYDDFTGFSGKYIDLAVVVPKQEKVALVITDEGGTARYDLRTMKAATDAQTQQMMQVGRMVEATTGTKKLTWSGGWSDGRNIEAIVLGLTLERVQLLPWAKTWAPAGQQFLRVPLKVDYTAKLYTPLELPAGAFVLTGKDGKKYVNTDKPIQVFKESLGGIVSPDLVFVVPANFAGGTLTFTMPSTIAVKYNDGKTIKQRLIGKGVVSSAITVRYP